VCQGDTWTFRKNGQSLEETGQNVSAAPGPLELCASGGALSRWWNQVYTDYIYFFGRTVSFMPLPTRNFKVVFAGI